MAAGLVALQAMEDKSKLKIIRTLLMEDANWKSFCFEPVGDQAEEMCCGWKATRPSATYELTKTRSSSKRRKVVPAPPATNTLPQGSNDAKECPYMSGELDKNYTYVYKGGLSDRGETRRRASAAADTALPMQPQLQKHVQTVTLEPNNASPHMQELARCRAELSRIMSLQVKPELLVEQLIIENRLRAMSLSAFPVLGGIDSQCRNNERAYSHSTPVLWTLPNTHVNYLSPRHGLYKNREKNPRNKSPDKHETRANMQWCDSLSSYRSRDYREKSLARVELPQLSFCQSSLHVREKSGPVKRTTTSKLTRVLSSGHASSSLSPHTSRYPLPVVAPSLPHDAADDRNSKRNRHLNALLYKSARENDGTQHHKSNSLTTGSTLYYPQVSYSNSKLK